MLSGDLGVSQAFLARWYIGGGYVDVSEVHVFYDCGKICVLTHPTPSLTAYNTVGMMHLKAEGIFQQLLDQFKTYGS